MAVEAAVEVVVEVAVEAAVEAVVGVAVEAAAVVVVEVEVEAAVVVVVEEEVEAAVDKGPWLVPEAELTVDESVRNIKGNLKCLVSN